jgi:hypothetical protein
VPGWVARSVHLCTSVNEEGGDGEGVDAEAPSLLSYTLRYVSLAELGTLCRVGLRDPMHLCACVSEEGGDGDYHQKIIGVARDSHGKKQKNS